jgi:hypothetical protein
MVDRTLGGAPAKASRVPIPLVERKALSRASLRLSISFPPALHRRLLCQRGRVVPRALSGWHGDGREGLTPLRPRLHPRLRPRPLLLPLRRRRCRLRSSLPRGFVFVVAELFLVLVFILVVEVVVIVDVVGLLLAVLEGREDAVPVGDFDGVVADEADSVVVAKVLDPVDGLVDPRRIPGTGWPFPMAVRGSWSWSDVVGGRRRAISVPTTARGPSKGTDGKKPERA